MAGEHRQPVRADLVRRVPVRGDPVGAGDHDVDLACRHARGRSAVDDDGMRDPESFELERRQAGPCSSGRVSSTQTCVTPPRSARARIAPTAEP